MPLSKNKEINLSVWKEICKYFCRVLYSQKNKKKEFAKLFLHSTIVILRFFQVETGFNFLSESRQQGQTGYRKVYYRRCIYDHVVETIYVLFDIERFVL